MIFPTRNRIKGILLSLLPLVTEAFWLVVTVIIKFPSSVVFPISVILLTLFVALLERYILADFGIVSSDGYLIIKGKAISKEIVSYTAPTDNICRILSPDEWKEYRINKNNKLLKDFRPDFLPSNYSVLLIKDGEREVSVAVQFGKEELKKYFGIIE